MAEDLSQQFTHLLRFKMSMQCITDGIVITDAFERVVFMNATMHDILSSQHKKYEVRTLKDLELLLGIFSENEEGASLPESFCRDEKTGRTFLAEKRKLMLAGERLHGFLICFSAVSALDGQPLKSSLKTAPAPLGDPHCPPAANRRKAEKTSIQSFVGQSKSVLRIKAIIKKVAPSSSTVLLQSESGTGKELLARSLHELSERAGGPFIKLNCASLPESLLEAEVFGYDSGAFTGAKKSGNPGLFEQAHTGTIFLDELGEMSLSLQAKLLRIIQEREVQRIGGQSSKQLDVRIVAATNRDLLQLVKQGRFRSDLLFRLNVVSITIPPLRERKEDIKSLIIYFFAALCAGVQKKYQRRLQGSLLSVHELRLARQCPGTGQHHRIRVQHHRRQHHRKPPSSPIPPGRLDRPFRRLPDTGRHGGGLRVQDGHGQPGAAQRATRPLPRFRSASPARNSTASSPGARSRPASSPAWPARCRGAAPAETPCRKQGGRPCRIPLSPRRNGLPHRSPGPSRRKRHPHGCGKGMRRGPNVRGRPAGLIPSAKKRGHTTSCGMTS